MVMPSMDRNGSEHDKCKLDLDLHNYTLEGGSYFAYKSARLATSTEASLIHSFTDLAIHKNSSFVDGSAQTHLCL